MAMLAEPRRKQKWSLNPRGTLWSDDQNKFGQKLMEKMGWNKGEGLGKDGQGMTDHIKANYKDNNKGIGYKGKDDEWIKHYDAFENVLAALNTENNSATNSANSSANNSANNSASNSPVNSEDEDEETKSRKSLEKRSKDSRARVHYHKFTRGKDLSNYKDDDLACILGSKKSKRKDPIHNAAPEEEVKEEVIEIEKKEEFIGDEIGTTKKEHGLVTIAGGNYQEYFAKKMAALKKQREGNGDNVNETQNKMQDKEDLSILNIEEDTSLETKKSKKKKKKDKDSEHSVICNDNSNIDQNEEKFSSANESMEKERKKKKCKKEVSNSNMLEENCIEKNDRPVFGFEFSCGFTNGSTVKRYPPNTTNVFSSDDEIDIMKDVSPKGNMDIEDSPKDKKKKHNKDQGSEETVESKDKKKKKKTNDTSFEMEETSVISNNEHSENTCEEVMKKKKKKKCKNKDEVEEINIVVEDENATEFVEKENVKKSKTIEVLIAKDHLPENTELKKKKKKKKKNKSKLEDDSLIIEEVSTEIKNNNDENVNLKEKRKGKKRKREWEEKENGTNENSKSKKFKKTTDNLSHGASQGKNKLKRQEYWRKRTEELKKKKKKKTGKHKKIKNKDTLAKKVLEAKNKDTLAKKVLQAFEGAKVPNIITKRDKKKIEQSGVP